MKEFTRIVVNGVEYRTLDEMPPEVRSEYERTLAAFPDTDGDGVPDVLQNQGSASGVVVEESIVVNGRKYRNRDELPPEIRELLDRMPKPGPGGIQTKNKVEVTTTKVLPPRLSVSTQWEGGSIGSGGSGSSGATPWLLVAGLVVVVLVLLFLWLSGVKPSELLRLHP